MPSQITNYKCLACQAPLRYDGTIGKLKCDHCDSVFDASEVEAYYAEKNKAAEQAFVKENAKENPAPPKGEPVIPVDGSPSETPIPDQPEGEVNPGVWNTSSLRDDWGEEASKMRTYNCPSCGAELICDETTAATSCPYCNNNTIIPGQFSGILKPDYIIPFKYDKEAAKAALANLYKGKHFIPNKFKLENVVKELKGIYVPFWLFNGGADADVLFDATICRFYSDGDFDVTETDHYNVRRAGTLQFEKIPADASTKMDDDLMDSIEPFDYSELKPFSTAYLPSFLANKYDVTAEENQQRADLRCSNTAVEALRNTVVGYASCAVVSKHVNLHRGDVEYALFPVWMLNTKWGDKEFTYAMNGQTGKIVGELPTSWPKFWLTFAAIFIVLSVILTILFSI